MKTRRLLKQEESYNLPAFVSIYYENSDVHQLENSANWIDRGNK